MSKAETVNISGTVKELIRLSNSIEGNPRYEIVLNEYDNIKLRIKNDVHLQYVIDSEEYKDSSHTFEVEIGCGIIQVSREIYLEGK